MRNPSPFAEAARYLVGEVPRPVLGKYSELHHAVKRRMRPIPNSWHMAVLDGIEMDVIHVALEVRFIADRVLPKPALPNSAFRFACTAG